MEQAESSASEPELRLVLLGSQRFGANAVASSILGLDPKAAVWSRRTPRSVSHCSEVNGTRVQLVKAPVWLRSYHLQDTLELVKQELSLCASLAPPGPHAFILLCEVDLPFTSGCARAVYAHMELLGPRVWDHTLVLFTCGDWLGRGSVEDYLRGEGLPLQELLQRCGGRYLLDATSEEPALSLRVMRAVREIMEAHSGQHFLIQQQQIQALIRKREEVWRRAEVRRERRERREKREREAKEQRQERPLSELTVVLLGWVFAEKTKVCNALLGAMEWEGRTLSCTRTRVDLPGLVLTVVDSPGWWKYFSAGLLPAHTRTEIQLAFRAYREAPGGRAVLLMIPADTSFTQEQLQVMEENLRPLGEEVWSHMVLVFTRGHSLGKVTIEQHIESEGDALVTLAERCGNRYFVFDGDADPARLKAQGQQLVQMVVDLCGSGPDRDTGSEPVGEEPTEKLQDEDWSLPVDEDLMKMVGVLHRLWAWGLWEIEEFASRFFERPLYEFTDVASMHLTYVFKGTSDLGLVRKPREEVERILRDEMKGKSLEEVVEAALQVYFKREVGAFDILSIICEKDQFKAEWKSLFEREWARREVRLKEYVFNRYVRTGLDQVLTQSYNKVSAWLDTIHTVPNTITTVPHTIEDLVRFITQLVSVKPVEEKGCTRVMIQA